MRKTRQQPRLIVPSEHLEQVSLCAWLDTRGIEYFAVPNGGKRSYKQAAWLKAEGLKKGSPDLVLIDLAPQDRLPVVIEMKRTVGGKQSADQLAMEQSMFMRGWHYFCCFGHLEAQERLLELGY